MRGHSIWIALALVGVGLGCGSEGKAARCETNPDCGDGFECYKPRADQKGICLRPGEPCLYSCDAGKIRTGSNCDCVDKYQVSVAAQFGGQNVTQIGAVGTAQVVVTVTKGSKDVGSLSTVALTADGTAVSSTPTIAHTNETTDTYTFDYPVVAGTESDVELRATAGAGDDAKTGSTTVSIDTKPPRVSIALGGGGGFGGGATIGLTVTVADAHPATGDLTLQLNGGAASLTLTSPSSDTANGVTTLFYYGQLTPEVMTAKGLPCAFDLIVTVSDALAVGTSDSVHQAKATGSTGITCGSGTVCAPQALYACNPTYTISMSGISSAEPVTTSKPRTITVAVTKGAASVTTADPSLSSGGASGVGGRTGPVTSADGLTGTYTWTYTPPTNTEGTYSFQASVGSGADQKTVTASSVIVDNVAPRIGVSFGGTQSNGKYLRTDTASIGVVVTDANLPASDRITVQATLDGTTVLGPANYSAGGGGGGGNRTYTVPLDLKGLSFDKLEKTLAVQVSPVTDGVGNASSTQVFSVGVTRLRWVTASASKVTDMTTPAIDGSGNLYAGRTSSDGNTAKVVKIDRTTGSVTPWTATNGWEPVKAAPVVGGVGLWVSSGGWVILMNTDNGSLVQNYSCNTGAAVSASPAVVTANGYDTVYAGNANGKLYQLPTGGGGGNFSNRCSNPTSIGADAIYVQPVITASGAYYVANAAPTPSDSFMWGSNWGATQPRPGGAAAFGALALDGTNVWAAVTLDSKPARSLVSAALSNGNLNTVLPAGGVYAASATPVLVKAGEVLIGEATLGQDGDYTSLYLGRVNSSNPNWRNPAIDGYSNGPLVLKDSNNASVFVVPTNVGTVYQFDKDGNLAWSQTLTSGGKALHEGNIFTENGVSTAYFGSADGHVYAVIVDGTLDTSSPWPRVGHDPQNTGHAN